MENKTLSEFLMENDVDTEVTSEVTVAGFPLPFRIRSISEQRNRELERQATEFSKNKFTRGQKILDGAKHNELLVAECTIDPNFKSAELQERYGVRGAGDLIRKVLRPGQFTLLLTAILELNGFVDDFEEKKEEVKN